MKYNFYTAEYPAENDVIIVNLTNLSEKGIYGKCLDYPNLQVFMPETEVAKRKVNITKFFSPAKTYAVVVLNVNEETNIVDISYRKINESDRETALQRFEQYEKLYNLGLEILHIYKINYDFNQELANALFKHVIQSRLDAYRGTTETGPVSLEEVKNAHEDFLENPKSLFKNFESNISKLIKNFTESVEARLHVTDLIMSCDFSLLVVSSSTELSSVERLRKILTENLPKNTVEYVSSPKYRFNVTAKTKTDAIKQLNAIADIIEENNRKYNGNLSNTKNYVVTKNKYYTLSNLKMN